MTVKLNKSAFHQVQELVKRGHAVADRRDAWSKHQPSAQEENEFIRLHGLEAYGKWHLGIDDEEGNTKKADIGFPKATSRASIAAAYSASRAGRGNTSITISSWRRRICTA